MPGKRRPRSPENDFFNELLDAVVDAVVDTAEPYIDKLAKEAVGNARRLIDQQATSHQPRPATNRPRDAGWRPPQPPPPPKPSPHPVITLYDVLEVSPHASTETIEAAYKSLAKRFHPDKNKDLGAESKMKGINHAYQILKDPEKRKLYNRQAQI